VFAGIVGTPLIWLAALQTGYTLAYQACDDRSNSWVVVPIVTALAAVIAVTAVVNRGRARFARDRAPMPLLGWIGLGMAALMIVSMVATAIPLMILHPCD